MSRSVSWGALGTWRNTRAVLENGPCEDGGEQPCRELRRFDAKLAGRLANRPSTVHA